METIYIDSLFFLNLAVDYLLLLVTGRICSAQLRRWLIALGAFIGAGYSVLVLLPGAGFLSRWPVKLAFAMLMVVVAFWREKHLGRCVVVFLAVSSGFGGAVYAVSIIGNSAPGGGLYFPVSLRVLLLSFAVCYCAVSLVFRRSADKTAREKLDMRIYLDSHEVKLRALRDTGNGLYDPISGCGVCIAESSSLEALFPGQEASLKKSDPLEMFNALSTSERYRGRLRLLPYSSLGNSAALITAFRPDRVVINGTEKAKLLIALSPTPLCADGEYSAIL